MSYKESEGARMEKACLKIEYVPISQLIPYAANARTHSDQQVEQIAASIDEFGFVNPVLVGQDGGIIAGHGRVLAAEKRKMAEVPTIVLGHLSDAQKRAFIIADNKLPENAGWDEELLKSELERLNDDGVDLTVLGFSDSELDELMKEDLNDIRNDGGAGGSIEQAIQLKPPREYVLVVCADDDGLEFEKLKDILGLKPVRRGGYKIGSPFDDIGTQRVVNAAQVIALIEGNEDADSDPE
jgi:hypothetical protein